MQASNGIYLGQPLDTTAGFGKRRFSNVETVRLLQRRSAIYRLEGGRIAEAWELKFSCADDLTGELLDRKWQTNYTRSRKRWRTHWGTARASSAALRMRIFNVLLM